jgi:hypothetical protein
MALYCHICRPDLYDTLSIQRQGNDGSATNSAEPLDAQAVGGPDEVLTPVMLAGMKQLHQGVTLGVHSLTPICLAPIAVKTGQRQIVECSAATLRYRHDVIHGKRHVLPLLGRMTVLTQSLGAPAHCVLLGA